jgi:hypothetical protein
MRLEAEHCASGQFPPNSAQYNGSFVMKIGANGGSRRHVNERAIALK